MAKSTNGGRRVHVSPGVYTSEADVQVAAKSLGITTLGLAGETVKGPAFQRISNADWKEYESYFGGTNTEKYRGSQYPKYELPYIAKEYLSQSQQLEVVRVLGLSGVNAGDAWVISAYKTVAAGKNATYGENNPLVIAVLRSRGEHLKAAFVAKADGTTNCVDKYEYDKIEYYAKEVKMVKSSALSLGDGCKPAYSTSQLELTIDASNYGVFTLEVEKNNGDKRSFSVSLNPDDNNYITKVLGTDPEVGDSEIYVEEFYDVALQQLIEEGELNTLGTEGYLPKYKKTYTVPQYAPVDDILTEDESVLTRRDMGKRFLYSSKSLNSKDNSKLKVHVSKDKGVNWEAKDGEVGHIYTVRPYTDTNGTRKYYYCEYVNNDGSASTDAKFLTEALGTPTVGEDSILKEVVKVLSVDSYYILKGGDVIPVTLDFNNYKEAYRYASTPWIVSEIKGSANHIELNRLFRFHTISDGNNSTKEFKVSIENIAPQEGTFDVVIRNFYDTDNAPIILERYKGCNLVPGDENYIAYRIGSFNDDYETKSKYVTVEVNETDVTYSSIPAGFMGYPVRAWNGNVIQNPVGGASATAEVTKSFSAPYIRYNTNVNDDIRVSKQYFGLSNITGIDADVLRYKGVEAYDETPEGLTPCFHLDSRLINGKPVMDETEGSNTKGHYVVKDNGISQVIAIDGIEGYEWVTVGRGNTTIAGIEPRIGKEEEMYNTIYEDKRFRKFTVAFYGGWDGWDFLRTYRSNTDDFKFQKYRAEIDPKSGEGISVSVLRNPEQYGFEEGEKVLNSDYYAYLSAIRQFANPKVSDINVLATPGIDYVNNNMLVGDVIEMVEEERADSVYVITTPDKPFGVGDGVSEMYTPSEVVGNLEDSEIDSNYACTFYPWVKVLDTAENQYIYLPPTKDVVRAFAYTDNVAQTWYAASGMNRGTVNGIKPKRTLKLGEQDTLYDNRINPISFFATEGMRIWGDKNLQQREGVMNRISKRRLMLRLRKLVSIACIGLIFDPNDPTMGQTVRSAIEKVMQDFRSKGGVVNYKIEIDDSQETRDRMEIGVRILVRPVVNLEYINIEFAVTLNGLLFEN